MAEKLPGPEILMIPQRTGGLPEIKTNGFHGVFIRTGGTTRPERTFQAGKAALFKLPHPVLDGAGAVSEKRCNLAATVSGTHEEYSMKPMIISRCFGPQNLLLHSKSHHVFIGDFEPAQSALLSLWQYVRKEYYAQ